MTTEQNSIYVIFGAVLVLTVVELIRVCYRLCKIRKTPGVGQDFHDFMVMKNVLSKGRVWKLLDFKGIGCGVVEEWVNLVTGQVVLVFCDPCNIENMRTVVDIRSNIADMVD